MDDDAAAGGTDCPVTRDEVGNKGGVGLFLICIDAGGTGIPKTCFSDSSFGTATAGVAVGVAGGVLVVVADAGAFETGKVGADVLVLGFFFSLSPAPSPLSSVSLLFLFPATVCAAG